ncbi:hypothetical protein [uncultured Roseobacter sp.]|uniref:hypothetical protein n=1 Tax=uncultured Roseobacter sp. TaxID=114847 RepID=UPI00260A8E1A|nr:hypothetical protein [uncultured Roseobacter sp.]
MTGPAKKKTVTPPRKVDLRCFAIVLMPVLIFATHKIIGTHLMPRDLNVPAGILVQGQDWLEAAGRYRFLAATWLFGALSVLAAAMLFVTLSRPVALTTRIAALLAFFFVLTLSALPSLRSFGDVSGGQVYDRLGKAVFDDVLSRGTLRGCTGPADTWLLGTCGEAPVITMFASVVDLVNIFAGLALGAIIVGMILCLNSRDCKDIEEEAALLAENLRHMRQQLYLSGLVLSFGMLYAASWIYWPLPLVTDAERSAYSAVLLSAALYTGTYFSLLMLSFYLPVAFILDNRVKNLANRAGNADMAGEPPDTQSWRSERGLKEGVADYLRAGFALTSPILAAFAGGISPLAL